MLRKLLSLSTVIILTSGLVESNNYVSATSIVNHQTTEATNNYLVAQASTYRVRLGDTLGGIANRFGVGFNRILSYNPQLRSRPNLIYVGETINLGGGGAVITSRPPSGGSRTYRVRRGDTLGGIAIRHGLSLRTIISYNPHLASRINSINVGETINVGSSQIVRRPRRNTTSRPPRTTTTTTTTTAPQPTTPTTTAPATPDTAIASAPSPRRATTFGNLSNERRQGSDNTGSKRGPDEACTKAQANMRAIAPNNGLQYTYEDYPYFFWYFPGVQEEFTAKPIEFILMSRETKEVNGKTRDRYRKVYEQKLNLTQPGIVAYALPAAEAQALEEGAEYKWRIKIECSDRTAMNLSYSIQRQSTDNPELIDKLENAPVDQHPVIFAESGVWFDALRIIALQLQQAPEDAILTEDWNNVLKLIGFEDLIGQPIQYLDAEVE